MEAAKRREVRRVRARLIEATPQRYAIGHWLLASPLILYLGWFWVDIFSYYSPIPWRWFDLLLGAAIYAGLVLLPVGVAAYGFVCALPRLFQHAGWDVQPLEPVSAAEQYTVRYIFTEKERGKTDSRRVLVRAAEGWVYLEIAAIFAGFILMIPLFFSATDFGFGR